MSPRTSEARRRVLIVDDEPDIRTVCRLVLEMVGGFQVETCACREDALQRMTSFAPELVLLDVMMPGENGLAVLTELRRLVGPTVCIAMLTASAQPAQVEAYRKAGADGVIEKPFDPRTLCSQVESLLAAHLSA